MNLEMEEVLEKLQATFVSDEPAEKTNFQDLYKNWGRLGNQEERRKELLEIQKHDRQNKLDKFRGIFEIVQRNEDRDIFKTQSRVNYTPNIYVAGFNTSPSYFEVLMLSEWIIEKPEDFYDNWYITPCPKGKRVLVVAKDGITKLYTKCGRFVTQFRTALPGGNPASKRASCTVIDCFYDSQHQTLHVLDLLAWNNQPMTDCETEFRHFWLKSQFSDLPQLNFLSKLNKIKFNLLPMILCTPESLNNFMMTYPPFRNFIPALDGLLFYHKRAHYISGETPLVGWLYPFMVPEVLGSDITVNPNYMLEKPKQYVDQATFIQNFEIKYAKRRNRRSKGQMDINDYSSNISNTDSSGNNKDDAMDAEEVVKQDMKEITENQKQNQLILDQRLKVPSHATDSPKEKMEEVENST
ncbi:snurportin-1 [Plodia interpunctella]|uniref:snurportin-1 n=1 Tax=Plodia interpunctella TaxID=58824 RepID=UPI00236813CC|nr:snurportin-1 [Plodia interpunctella]